MKTNKLILVIAFITSVFANAQKDQIKAAEKALKAGNPSEAVTILQAAETNAAAAPDNEKAQYFYVSGNAYLALVDKKIDEAKNLGLAAKSYKEVIAVESKLGKDKFSSLSKIALISVKNKLVNSAVEDTKANRSLESAIKIYDAYLLDKKDTINLYFAASGFDSSKDYANALKCYTELKELNYSGKETLYFATNKANNLEESFNSEKDRDLGVKIGTHEKPRKELIPSKRGEIYKNIALILIQDGKIDEAKKAISDARKANPEDNTLLYTEANLYLETKDYDTYSKLVKEALEKNPNDADLLFNLAVISSNAKKNDEAKKYYNKAIEINPKYTNAYINLAAIILEDDEPILNQMNKLGTSEKDNKKYTVLKQQRNELFKSVIPLLVKANELEANSIPIMKTLAIVYNALDMMPEYKEFKAKIKALEGK